MSPSVHSAPVLLRTSERKALKRCPQMWKWGWIDGLKPTRPKNHFWFGIGVHEALAAWYLKGARRGPHPAESWEAYCDDEERFIPLEYEEDKKVYIDARTLGTLMLKGYVDKYGKDSNWNVISTEQTFTTMVDNRFSDIKSKYIAEYLGTFDGVYRDLNDGCIWLMEHKTAAGLRLDHLPLDDQAGSYWWAAEKILKENRLIKKTDYVVGVMYNFLMKQPPDTRPVNAEGLRCNQPVKAHYLEAFALSGMGFGPKAARAAKLDDLEKFAKEVGITVLGEASKLQPGPRYHREPVWRSESERASMETRIQDEAKLKYNMLNDIQPVFKSPDIMNCNMCDFKRMCMIHEAGGDWEEFRDLAFTTIDPYSDHRENRKPA